MTEKDAANLELVLKDLKLSGFVANWQYFSQQGSRSGWSYAKYLSSLCYCEQELRAKNKLARQIKESKLPINKNLGSFDFSANKSIKQAQIATLAEDRSWVRQGANVIIFGPTGVGKTHLAAAIGFRQLEVGTRVLFCRTTHLVQQLQLAKSQSRLSEELRKLDKFKILVLDDIGYVKKTEYETSVLFELVSHRYEISSLIITTNQPFSEWDQIFSDNLMAASVIDRLVHRATIIKVEGDSYRQKLIKS